MSNNRYETTTREILHLIQSRNLSPGSKLPPERSLADMFNVSRNSVREAVRVLAEKRVLESRRGDGTYVTINADEITVMLGREKAEMKQRIHDMFEFRQILEPEIAALAATHIKPNEIAKLKSIVLDQQRAFETGENDKGLDEQFHQILSRATRNTVLVSTTKAISEALSESHSMRTVQRSDLSLKGHLRIIEAMEQHDAQAARKAMKQHLDEVSAFTLSQLATENWS